MDKVRVTWNDLKDQLATMNTAIDRVLMDLRSDFGTTREEDIRELMITLQNAGEVVIAGCENLTENLHIIDSISLMSDLYSEAGTMLDCGHKALTTFRTSHGAGQTRLLQILEQKVWGLRRALEDFEYTAHRIIDME